MLSVRRPKSLWYQNVERFKIQATHNGRAEQCGCLFVAPDDFLGFLVDDDLGDCIVDQLLGFVIAQQQVRFIANFCLAVL